MKIGNTSYNVEAVKQMGYEKFKAKYPVNAKDVYEKITGEKIIDHGENVNFCETVAKELPNRKKKDKRNKEFGSNNGSFGERSGMGGDNTSTE